MVFADSRSLTSGYNDPESDEGVAVVRFYKIAVQRSRVAGTVAPASAARHARGTGGRPLRIVAGTFAVVLLSIQIGTPFPNIARHIVDAQIVGLFSADDLRLASGISTIPGVITKGRFIACPCPFLRLSAAAGGIFPLGLSWQTIFFAALGI